MTYTVENPKWKCLVCKAPLLEIIVDKYQEEIIRLSKGQYLNVYISN